MPTAELKRRIRTARAWGGFSSVKALAAAIPDHGYSTDTLTDIENGVEDRVTNAKLGRIAEACGVPREFLTDENYDPFSEQLSADDLFAALGRIETKIDGGLDLLAEALSEDTMAGIRSALQGDQPQGGQSHKGGRP